MLIKLIIFLGVWITVQAQYPPADRSNYEKYVVFRCWKNASNPVAFISTFNQTLESQGCPATANFSLIIHGWLETPASKWVDPMVKNLLKASNGCVCFADYSSYSQNGDYFGMVYYDYLPLARLMGRKILQIGNLNRLFLFGFSFGARIATEIGIVEGKGQVGRIDLCEPAGPGFQGGVNDKKASLAGKNVAVISTSNDKGTTIYTGHQNWRMGYCGWAQSAAGGYPMGSHGLCPHFYNSAFNLKFSPNGGLKKYGCPYTKLANVTSPACAGAAMGYNANFNKTSCQGEFFVDTASTAPYWMA